MKNRYTVALVLAAVLFISPVFADYYQFNVPDSSEIREGLVETWFTAPLEALRMKDSENRSNAVGQQFQIRLEEQESTFAVLVAPQVKVAVNVYSNTGTRTILTEEYPGDVSGSWLLVRDRQTGDPVFIRYYFMADSDVYIQLSPGKKRTSVDMVIYGNYAARSFPLGIPWENFYTASFSDVYSRTKKSLPWRYCIVNRGMYHSTMQMIQVIREHLPDIVYTDDAMYDESGQPVYISTGKKRQINEKETGKLSFSSAGFVKWIVDGLVMPLRGSYIRRVPLLASTVRYKNTGFPGTLSSEYDLSFSLDWTRNLAAALFSVHSARKYLYPDSGVDVAITPFSGKITAEGVVNSAGYVKDSGYSCSDLQGLLYVLAATEPCYCYLAAIRQTSAKSPEVRPFNESAAIFPYFDSSGRFGCVVFENGKELTLHNFMARYKNDFVHLVRVQTSDRFFPQM